jgi:hypothetical protein
MMDKEKASPGTDWHGMQSLLAPRPKPFNTGRYEDEEKETWDGRLSWPRFYQPVESLSIKVSHYPVFL